MRTAYPSLELTTDGNHPTLAGSYLYALAIYAEVSGAPVRNLTYVPSGLDANIAALLRAEVDQFPLDIK